MDNAHRLIERWAERGRITRYSLSNSDRRNFNSIAHSDSD
jgi:hypothetical protein